LKTCSLPTIILNRWGSGFCSSGWPERPGPAALCAPNEILCSRNEPDKFRLALVPVAEDGAQAPRYLRGFVSGEPDFAETTRTFSLRQLLECAGEPG